MENNIKYLSFSSPKGGVGRTLTLSNCAKIYAKGSKWAGIAPAITVLADLDFHAPGIHYYDFSKIESDEANHFRTNKNIPLRHNDFLTELKTERIGLLFLLSDILNDRDYKENAIRFAEELRIKERPPAEIYRDLNQYIKAFLESDEYNPICHMVTISYAKTRIYVFPAASPNHKDYQKSVFNFNWLEFNQSFGLFLLDAIFLHASTFIKKEIEMDIPVRILIDQQAGVSIASALNRTLGDANIIVSGLNWQNKEGLEGLISNYCELYKRNPWVVLNQYNFRKIALQSTLDLNAHQTTPHEEFRRIDHEVRGSFIKQICHNNQDLREKVFLTEFINDAVQREHFYDDKELAIKELIRMVVSIEKSFLQIKTEEPRSRAKETIVFIGERIFIENKYSGPLNGIYKLLQLYFPKSTIIVLAVTHEDIVSLTKEKRLNGKISLSSQPGKSLEFGELQTAIYNFDVDPEGETQVSLEDIDLISYPHHLKSMLNNQHLIRRFSEEEFVRRMPTMDTLEGTSMVYYEENILRWKEYAGSNHKLFDNVPLFVNFQLLAYRKELIYKNQDFKKAYRKNYHRDFEGFRNPQDLIDFAKLTSHVKAFDDVLLCGNPDNIAMWYEWQTIFSLFYDKTGDPPANRNIQEYYKFLIDGDAINASFLYLTLLQQVNLTEKEESDNAGYDWDKLIQDFYVKENKGLIFIWPDAIPQRKNSRRDGDSKRTDNGVIYQVPPSFHLFEECWQLSIVEKPLSRAKQNALLEFMNYFLTPAAQNCYTHEGGLPTHKQVLSSLDIWNVFPFIPPMWSVYNDQSAKKILTKRDSFENNYEAGKRIAKCLKTAYLDKDLTPEKLRSLFIRELTPLLHTAEVTH